MGNFISNFETTADFAAFSATTDCIKPHLSLTQDDGKIHFMKTDPYNGHDYVEIGGLKWATMNVGANSITDTGLYFQWGDTQGYTASQVGSGEGKKNFGWGDYKYSNGGSSAADMTKYNSTDGKTVLEASDDAVQASWGGAWRMPTRAEFQALGAAVNAVWTTNYNGSGIKGLVCTAKDGSGAQLFFPTAGRCFDGGLYGVESECRYWSSSLLERSVNFASCSVFLDGVTTWDNIERRYYGFAVRGVAD